MNKLAKRIGQVLTGAAATATLIAGHALASTTPINTTDQPIDSATPATTNPIQDGADAAQGQGMPAELIGQNGVFTQITNTILFAVGIISVIMLIWGGIRYVTSGGDAKKVTDAKNTVLYAIIGLIVAILSYAIVNFIINALSSSPAVTP